MAQFEQDQLPYFLADGPEPKEEYILFKTNKYGDSLPLQSPPITFVNIRRDLVDMSRKLKEIAGVPKEVSLFDLPYTDVPDLDFGWKINIRSLLQVMKFLEDNVERMKYTPLDNVDHTIFYLVFRRDFETYVTGLGGCFESEKANRGVHTYDVAVEQAVAIYNCVIWLNLYPLPYEVN